MTPLARARLARSAEAVHRLGARPVFELLDEIGKRTGYWQLIAAIADDFAAIDLAALRALGGDRFAPPPIREVSR
jgi:hypothetical protein